ncbi:MAG: HRDC domain-containing protein [Actinobacteria bacterium]|nr:HRDC domain-containing protein [Actinomycetota bacterium]
MTLGTAGEEEVGSFFRALSGMENGGRANVPPNALSALGGVDQEAAGIVLGSLEESGLIHRGYDLWAEVEVRRLEEEQEGLREEVAAVHAALPGSGTVGLPALARRAGVRPAVAQGAVYRMMVDGTAEIIPRGSVVDVRLKASTLDGRSRRAIAARLKNRATASYAQIRDVEAYANLTTCRREYLLRHFGDREEVAPCAGCDVCLGDADEIGKPSVAPTQKRLAAPAASDLAQTAVAPRDAMDLALFERLKRWRGEQARRQRVPAYVVLHNSHLEEIAARKPRSIHELGSIKGVGLRRAARYGEELLALVQGQEAAAPDSTRPDYHSHLEAAGRLLRSGRGADAVPELVRALEMGGDEARKAVNKLLELTS